MNYELWTVPPKTKPIQTQSRPNFPCVASAKQGQTQPCPPFLWRICPPSVDQCHQRNLCHRYQRLSLAFIFEPLLCALLTLWRNESLGDFCAAFVRKSAPILTKSQQECTISDHFFHKNSKKICNFSAFRASILLEQLKRLSKRAAFILLHPPPKGRPLWCRPFIFRLIFGFFADFFQKVRDFPAACDGYNIDIETEMAG